MLKYLSIPLNTLYLFIDIRFEKFGKNTLTLFWSIYQRRIWRFLYNRHLWIKYVFSIYFTNNPRTLFLFVLKWAITEIKYAVLVTLIVKILRKILNVKINNKKKTRILKIDLYYLLVDIESSLIGTSRQTAIFDH